MTQPTSRKSDDPILDAQINEYNDALERRAQSLKLKKPFYELMEAKDIIGIGRSKLYTYLSDPETNIRQIRQGRKRMLSRDDVKRLWVLARHLHSFQFTLPKEKEPEQEQRGGQLFCAGLAS